MSFRSKRSHHLDICACRLLHCFSHISSFSSKVTCLKCLSTGKIPSPPSLIFIGYHYHYGPQVASVTTWPHPLQSWNIFIILLKAASGRLSLSAFTPSFHPFILSFQTYSLFSHSLPLTHARTHARCRSDKIWGRIWPSTHLQGRAQICEAAAPPGICIWWTHIHTLTHICINCIIRFHTYIIYIHIDP